MISADFLASSYAYGRELRRALDLHDQERLRLVPVIGRNCKWQNLPFARLQVLPEGAVAISSWQNRDDAFVSVVLGVERVAREILSSGDSLVDDWLTSRLLRRRVLMAVQQHLRRIGLYAGPIDGIPGPDTEAAVISFQRRVGTKMDAMIGPEVIRRLEDNSSPPVERAPTTLAVATRVGPRIGCRQRASSAWQRRSDVRCPSRPSSSETRFSAATIRRGHWCYPGWSLIRPR